MERRASGRRRVTKNGGTRKEKKEGMEEDLDKIGVEDLFNTFQHISQHTTFTFPSVEVAALF